MKLIRSIAATTDYTYHGSPCEVTRVDLYCDEDLPLEVIDECKRNQERQLEHAKKSELWSDYWKRVGR